MLYHSMQAQPKEAIIIYLAFTITTMIFYLQALSVDVHKAKKLAKCGHELILEHAFARLVVRVGEKDYLFSGITVEYADTINELSLEHAFATYFECII